MDHIHRGVYIAVGGALVIFGGVFLYLKTTSSSRYQLAHVVRGPITENVLASGHVESPTTFQLHFKASGRMTVLNAVVGQKVSVGTLLARQDSGVLSAQRDQATAAVSAATAALHKLQEGARDETVAVSQAQLEVAQQSLRNSYGSVPYTLQSAYAKANDATITQIAPFFSNTFSSTPMMTFATVNSAAAGDFVSERMLSSVELGKWQTENNAINSSSDTATLDSALDKANTHLFVVQKLLSSAVKVVAGNVSLTNTEASTYRTNAYAGLSEVNVAISELHSLQQAIASGKAAVEKAKADLSLTSAGSTATDIEAAKAAVAQAEANVSAIDAQLRELSIIAPLSGTISETGGDVGEIVTPDKTVVTLLPEAKLEVKVNVSEDNIVGVNVGDTARIELDAFPTGTSFAGTVRMVDPAQTIVGGAVYYKTTLSFDAQNPEIKPGMTANVWIKTGSSEGALIVPASALTKDGLRAFVQVYQDGKATKHEVTTGLKGIDGMVEIVGGLNLDDQVVIGE